MAEARSNQQAPAHRGRPPIPADVARRNRLVTFVTDRELEQLSRIADESGASMSGICHQILAGYLRRQKNTSP
jgi:hypothetical protein